MLKELRLKNILFILLGSAIFAFGIVHFNIENHLAEGGFTGLTLILLAKLHINPSYSNIILNVPVFIVGWKLLGNKSFFYTVIGTVAVSIFLFIFERDHLHFPLTNDLFLAALFAGVFIGVGLGIIFRNGGTSGGVDIIARLVFNYKGIPMGRTMFLFDACVIILSLLTYLDYREGMYTLVAVFVGARVVDFMQEGSYTARGAIIISEKFEEIATCIHIEMNRGVTILNGKGAYSKIEKDVLYCVVAKNEIVRLKTLIHQIDPHAFVSVLEVHDVLGEGFTLDEEKQPLKDG